MEGDEVVAADGVALRALPTDEAISLIKGPADSVVRLSLRRGDRTFDVSVVRRRLRW